MLCLLFAALLCADYLNDVCCSPLLEAERALQDDGPISATSYMNNSPETFDELLEPSNYALTEGDMMLPDNRNVMGTSWSTLEIPYVISPDLASRTDDILSAMGMVSKDTCVSFHKRTTERDYLLFKASTGCASFLGMKGGEQPVFVGPQCIVGNIVHEILHALGFHHEHTRKDREQYITIIPSNIMPGMEKNFKKQEGETFSLPYDIYSILHYGRNFFSATGLPTIIPNKEAKEMGQRNKMTKMDIERVRLLYNCDSLKHQTEEESGQVEDVMSDLGSTNGGNSSHTSLTPTSAEPPASLQHLDNATRGPSNISSQQGKK